MTTTTVTTMSMTTDNSGLSLLSKLLDDSAQNLMPVLEVSMLGKRSKIASIEDEDAINALLGLKSQKL
jgi:hypothetical protein